MHPLAMPWRSLAAASFWLCGATMSCPAQGLPTTAPAPAATTQQDGQPQPAARGPRVVIPVAPPQQRAAAATPPPGSAGAGQPRTTLAGAPGRTIYPWKQNITATVFWIGEEPSGNNPTPNNKSSWDQEWVKNFGGYDDPDPAKRSDFRPLGFIPKLNPFYVALPYNDVDGPGAHRPEAPRAIPWFRLVNPEPGKTTLKGRWLQIVFNGKSCFAQWEDCGPWVTDDWQYVFGNQPPKNTNNNGAAIDVSPAVRDFLGMRSGDKVHWRFVEASQVPAGPWHKFGNPSQPAGGTSLASNSLPPGRSLEIEQLRSEQLRRVRDEIYKNKSKWELQNGN